MPEILDDNLDPEAQLRTTAVAWSRRLLHVVTALAWAAVLWGVFGRIEIPVRVEGTVKPEGDTQVLQCTVSGRLKTVSVREGQSVKQGDILAVLDDAEPRAKLAALRQESLFVEEQIRQDRNLGGKDAQILAGLQRVASVRAQILELEQSVAAHVQRSPVSGIVSEVLARPFDQVQQGQKLCSVLPNNAGFHIDARLPSSEIRRVRPGQTVKILLPAYPEKEFGYVSGLVESIAPEAGGEPPAKPDGKPSETVAFRMRVRIAETEDALARRSIVLKPGLPCEPVVITEKQSLLRIFLDSVAK